MATNKIEIFQHNTLTFDVSVYNFPDASGYTPYFTIKKKATDASAAKTITGTVKDASGTLRFNFTSTDTSLAAGDYVYDINLEKDASIYTLVKDRISIIDGVRY